MKLEIKDILGKHKNNPCIIIGHGRNLNTIRNKLTELKQKGFILIGINDWYKFHIEKPHYFVVCNHMFSIEKRYENFNQQGVTLFYSDVQELTDRNEVDKLLRIDYLPFDHKHFDGKPCPNNPEWAYKVKGKRKTCCEHLIPGRLTLSEELQKLSGNKERCGRGECSIDRMIIFGILMGCNPIYITGLNLSYNENSTPIKERPVYSRYMNIKTWTAQEIVQKIHNDFRIIDDSAKLLGIKIINLNKNIKYNEFEKGDLKF